MGGMGGMVGMVGMVDRASMVSMVSGQVLFAAIARDMATHYLTYVLQGIHQSCLQ